MRIVDCAALATLLLACSSPQARQVDALMESPIVPASDAIFNAVVYADGQLVASPKTDAEWARLRQHARSLVVAASSLKTLTPSIEPDRWIQMSDLMGATSSEVLEAIDNRSLEGVLEAGSRMYDSCTSCHAAYVKDN